jgi:hypothetical protein
MFSNGDKVRVTADWLAVLGGSRGEVLGEVFQNPLTCLVRFPSGTKLIPAVLLERTQSAAHLVSAA